MRYDPVGVVCCIHIICYYKYLNPLGSANQLSFLCKKTNLVCFFRVIPNEN